MKKLLLWAFLSSALFAEEGPKGAYQTFLEDINFNFYPQPNPNKGVLDGNRRPPERVTFSKENIKASEKIKTIIVIFQENWSFDSLYGKFAEANALDDARAETKLQVDLMGKVYDTLLPCVNTKTGLPYPEIPTNLRNGPFDLADYLPMNKMTGDAFHRFYEEQYQINGGLMNRFATFSNAGGFAMSYYDISNTDIGRLSKEYVLCDNWFHSCYGGSMCGALWLFAGQMPTWPNADESITARLLPSQVMIKDGLASPDGFAINDAEPFFEPYKKGVPKDKRVPPQSYKTIGDLLTEKDISWGWYAEGWDEALQGNPAKTFAFHHQAPSYFTQFAPHTAEREKHVLDFKKFEEALQNNQIPAVCFIRSIDHFSEHPGEAPLLDGLNWCADLIKKIQNSPVWNEAVIIVSYDENGGRWDHVSPPVVDRFGPGTRVPTIIISPFAKRGFIDHTSYETVSILKFIEERFGLSALSSRDAAANNILNAFDFGT